MSAAEQEWEPGDPLYSPETYSNYFFNFRPISNTEECRCMDRARWPVPMFWGDDLGRHEDELEAFIRDHREGIGG